MNFSVVIPTFNRRQQIGEAVDSVLSQESDRVAVEVIVVDDHSQDDTVKWLETNYGEDSRVRVILNSRSKGPAGARNSGIISARFPYIAFLDSDDLFLPGHLFSAAKAFETHPKLDVIFGRARYMKDGIEVPYMGPNFEKKIVLATVITEDENIQIFETDFFSHLLEYGCYFNLSSVVLHATDKRPLMNESLRIAEDFEFWVRLARTKFFGCLKEKQICYKLHESNISFEKDIDPSGNAPMLIRAYNFMLAYPDLRDADYSQIKKHIAQQFFDWAWRCKDARQIFNALKLHLKSARYGLRRLNTVAIAKLPIALIIKRKNDQGGISE
ncbi:hypothetical protein AGMMS50256_14030 [Betaproteobacteria bacterium]|nr:hypothetical protein AGMMS50256_14030 [Betaproteobacteria bacterium]